MTDNHQSFDFSRFTEDIKAWARALGFAAIGISDCDTTVANQRLNAWLARGFHGDMQYMLLNRDLRKHPEKLLACTTCINICPTKAIIAPYQLDARRCISYLTIEYKGSIDPKLRPLMGNRIYGCDDCQLFCPWNKFAKFSREND